MLITNTKTHFTGTSPGISKALTSWPKRTYVLEKACNTLKIPQTRKGKKKKKNLPVQTWKRKHEDLAQLYAFMGAGNYINKCVAMRRECE